MIGPITKRMNEELPWRWEDNIRIGKVDYGPGSSADNKAGLAARAEWTDTREEGLDKERVGIAVSDGTDI